MESLFYYFIISIFLLRIYIHPFHLKRAALSRSQPSVSVLSCDSAAAEVQAEETVTFPFSFTESFFFLNKYISAQCHVFTFSAAAEILFYCCQYKKKKTTESWEYLHCRPELLLFVLYSVCQTLRQREACRCRQQLCLCLLITTLSGLNHWSPPVLSPFCYVLSNSLLLPQRCLLLPCGPQLVPDNLPLFSGAFCLFSNISPPLKPEQLWLFFFFFLSLHLFAFFPLPSSSGSRFRYLSVFLWWNIFGWVPLFCTCDFIFGGIHSVPFLFTSLFSLTLNMLHIHRVQRRSDDTLAMPAVYFA